VNIHANRWSSRVLTSPLRFLHLARPRRSMSIGQARRAIEAAGFDCQKIHGYGFVTRTLYRLLGPRLSERVERLACSRRYLHRWATHVMLVATRPS
jgi:hypothetical protein